MRVWRRTRPTALDFVAVAIATLPPLRLRARADLAGLAGLAADALLGVLDALRLVCVRHAQPSDARRHLAHELLIGARDLQLLRRLERERDARGRIDLDRVREPERELQLLPREHSAVSGAADLEVTSVSGGDAGDHVLEKGASQAVQGTRRLRVVLALHDQRPVLARDGHIRVEGAHELALRPLHAHGVAVDLHVDALRHGNGEATDATHITRCRRGLPRPTPSSRPRAPS